jgi:chromosome partitioning protein
MSFVGFQRMNPPSQTGSPSPASFGAVRRIAVMNPKGGCGKTTVATNLASRYAVAGLNAALFDYDPLGASLRWLRARAGALPAVHGVAAHGDPHGGVTRSWQLRVPAGTQRIVHDTPAGLERMQILERIEGVDAILVPVLPSPMDISATADFIRDLLLVGKLRTRNTRVGIISNRVKSNTRAFQALERFLATLDIPLVGQVRETQNYVTAAQTGIGVHELSRQRDERDMNCWLSIMEWLESPWREPEPTTGPTDTEEQQPAASERSTYSTSDSH